MKVKYLVGFMAALLMWSCSDEEAATKQKIKSNVEYRSELIAKVDSMETEMREKSLAPESELTGELMQSYTKFAELFPGDKEKSPEYLYKAAALARSVDLPVKAIKQYDLILKRYPDWIKAPEVAFLIAFTYDEDLEKIDLAKEAYEKVIAKYPGDQWAVQAEQRLETIDMSEEELLEFLRERSDTAQSGA
jgi:tetratricopeptide (TPR) repeat protein